MSYTLVFTDQYNRRAARFLKRHVELRELYRGTLLLQANPHHPSLRLHVLGGKLSGSFGLDQSFLSHYARTADPRTADRSSTWATMKPRTDANNARPAHHESSQSQ